MPGGEFGEEPLHEIQPRRRSGREVEVHARVFGEPGPNGRVLVGSIVVENDVDVEFGQNGTLHLSQESQEILVPVTRHTAVRQKTQPTVTSMLSEVSFLEMLYS